MRAWVIALVVLCSVLGAVAQVLLKRGSDNFELNIKHLITNYCLLLGVVLYGLAFVLYLFALRFGNVTQLYPIISLSYVWVMLLAWQWLDESINIFKIIGSLIIIVGVWLVVM